MSTNSSSSSSNQYDFLVPIILVRFPVIKHASVKVIGGQADKTEVEEELDTREGCLVEDGKVGTFLCVTRCQKKKQGNCRVESSLLDNATNGISG